MKCPQCRHSISDHTTDWQRSYAECAAERCDGSRCDGRRVPSERELEAAAYGEA